MKANELKDKLFDNPAVFNKIRSIVLMGKEKMYYNAKKAVNQEKNESVLDVCCGTGEFAHLFNNRYLGIDLNPAFIFSAKRNNPGKKFQVMDVMAPKLKGRQFDKAVLLSMTHHFSDIELDKIFRQLRRIVKNRIIIMDPIPNGYNPLSWLLYKLDRGRHIRRKAELERLVSKYCAIEQEKEFNSFLYRLLIVSCKWKGKK